MICIDDQSRVLLVRPTYKDYWDVPGGYVTQGESPRDAAIREVREELGVDVRIGHLLAVDWAPSVKDGDKLLFLFSGQLPSDAVFSFADGEIDETRYVDVDELEGLTIDRLCRRIRSSIEASVSTYLEHGVAVRGAATPGTGTANSPT